MRRRLAQLGTLITAVAAGSGLAVADAGGASSKSTAPVSEMASSPALFPSFRPDIRDYVARCGDQGLHLKATAASGGELTLDGQPVIGPSVDQSLTRLSGEATTLQGRRGARQVTYHIRCLPADFPTWRVRRPGTPQAEWYLMTPQKTTPQPTYVAVFDNHGVPVWWMHSGGQAINATVLSHHRIAWALRQRELLSSQSRPFEVHRLDGVRTGTIATPDVTSDWHELRPLSNGNFLILGDKHRNHVNLTAFGGPRDATVLDGIVEEVTADGQVKWKWNSSRHIGLAESARWFSYILNNPVVLPDGRKAYDLVHLNAADPDGSNVVISSRHTDAVYAVSRSTGRVVWKLGGTHTARSLLVTFGGPADNLFGGQHDVRVLSDGTITAHDNRSLRFEPPRAVRIRLLLRRREAQVIEHVSDPSLHSYYFGSARKLPTGDWVVSWGSSSRMAEISPKGRRVFQIDFQPGFGSYRAVPIMPGAFRAAAFRTGMDAIAVAAGGQNGYTGGR